MAVRRGAPVKRVAKKAVAAPKAAATRGPDKAPRKPTITQVHKDDMARLLKNLKEAADRQGLCDEFLDELDRINEGLTVPLPIETIMPELSVDITATLVIRGAKTSSDYGRMHLDQDAQNKLENALEAFAKANGWELDDWSIDSVDRSRF